jgi:hypothetical protein
MPFSSSLFRDPDLLVIRFSGHVTLAETRKVFTVAMRPPIHCGSMPGLVDLGGLVSTDAGFTDVLAIRDGLAEAFHGKPRPILIAILASGGTGFGMARMFQTLAEEIPGVHVEIFDSLDAALGFHELDAAAFPELLVPAGEDE